MLSAADNGGFLVSLKIPGLQRPVYIQK